MYVRVQLMPVLKILHLLFQLSTGLLICSFNVFYRSTWYCFMRVLRNIVFSPFYKVRRPLKFSDHKQL